MLASVLTYNLYTLDMGCLGLLPIDNAYHPALAPLWHSAYYSYNFMNLTMVHHVQICLCRRDHNLSLCMKRYNSYTDACIAIFLAAKA